MNAKDNRCTSLEDFLRLFDYKIYKSLSQTAYQEREDLAQEIRLKMIEKYNNQIFNDSPDFWDIVDLQFFL